MDTIAKACPRCGRRLDAGAVRCMNCGQDQRVHVRVVSVAVGLLSALRPRRRPSPGVLGVLVGLALAAVLVASLLAAIRNPEVRTVHLVLALTCVGLGWVVGFLHDLRTRGFFSALMWCVPFARSSLLTTFAVGHELAAPRLHHRHPVLEAIVMNALLALLSLVILFVVTR